MNSKTGIGGDEVPKKPEHVDVVLDKVLPVVTPLSKKGKDDGRGMLSCNHTPIILVIILGFWKTFRNYGRAVAHYDSEPVDSGSTGDGDKPCGRCV
jgi:hypothetical protein